MRLLFALPSLCAVLLATPLFAHSLFLTAAGAGEKRIAISSGHSFPDSEVKIGEGLIQEFYVTDPDGVRTDLKVSAGEKVLNAAYSCAKDGIYIATLRYKPNFVDGEPPQFAHTVFMCGDAERLKQGFKTPGALQFVFAGRGQALQFAVVYNGAGVAGRVELSYFNGKTTESSFIQTGRNGDFSFVSKGRGLYMLSFAHKGINLTLTFEEP